MLTMDDEDNRAHFNLDDLLIEKKGKKSGHSNKTRKDDESKKKDDDFEVIAIISKFILRFLYLFIFSLNKLDVKDPRFQAIFTSHEFNIDPSDQSFKKTKAMEHLLDEKIKRIEKNSERQEFNHQDKQETEERKKKIMTDESLLVRSIKSKTEVLKRKQEENQQKLQKLKKF